MKKFFALDRKNPNGQVEWAEWLADFEKRFDPEEKTTRLYKVRDIQLMTSAYGGGYFRS